MYQTPDLLIDKKVKTSETDNAYVAAVLLYWASLHTFITSKEHDDDLGHYLDILESDNPQALGQYLMESIRNDSLESEKRDSLDRMQLCCRLIDGATADIYPDDRARKMLCLLFKILERDITNWND